MGLFGGKKVACNAPGGVYIDMDGQPIPVAVAVSSAPPPSPQGQQVVGSGVQVVYPQKQFVHSESKQGSLFGGGSKRNVVAAAPMSGGSVGSFLPPMLFSRFPTVVKQCPVCHQRNARTRIVTAPDFLTWIAVAVLLVVFWPLCWIPLVSDACRRTTHYCASCNAPLGSVRPFHDCCVKRR